MTTDLFKHLPDDLKSKIQQAEQPHWVEPMLASLTYNYFSNPNWIYECKLDGVRTLIFKKGDKVTLYSRNQVKQNNSFPELVKAFREMKNDFILDGEIVTFDKNKVSSFSRLQPRINVLNPDPELIEAVPVSLFIFDIIYCNGFRVDALPLKERKLILQKAIQFKKPIFYLEHREKEGEAFLDEACKKGWEGLIAKDATAAYEHKRSKKWLKFKCIHQQELVIAGYTKPRRSRIGFGALLVGFYEGNKLKYAGRVGTGYTQEFLRDFHKRIERIKQDSCPFDNFDESDEDVTWVKPEFVGEVGFTEWTSAGKLRHPRFLGLRYDKSAKEVVKED